MSRRVAYSKEEDDALWTWVNVTCTDDPVAGRTLWTKLVDAKLLPGRSWESLKERYRRYVVPAVRNALDAASGAVPEWKGERLVNLTTVSLDSVGIASQQQGGDADDADALSALVDAMEEEGEEKRDKAEDAGEQDAPTTLSAGAVCRVLRRLPCRAPVLQVLASQGATVRLSDGTHWLDVHRSRAFAGSLEVGASVSCALAHVRVMGVARVILLSATEVAPPRPIVNEAALAPGTEDGDELARATGSPKRAKRELPPAPEATEQPQAPVAQPAAVEVPSPARVKLEPEPPASPASTVPPPPPPPAMDPVKRARLEQLVLELEQKSGQPRAIVLHALFVTNGHPDTAIEYLCTTAAETDVQPWLPTEDVAIGPTIGLAELQRDNRLAKRTVEDLGRRRAFLFSP